MITRAILMLIALASSPASASDISVSGRPVQELKAIDDMMLDFLDENTEITAAIVGLMQDGRVIYLKGFGVDYYGLPLPENTPVRIASVTKPIVAAAIRRLITGTEGLDENSFAFGLGQQPNGILPASAGEMYEPFFTQHNPLLDERLKEVTIQHLLEHRGGWDRGIEDSNYNNRTQDYMFWEREIANDMSIPSPPGWVNVTRWVLGRALDFTPGGPETCNDNGPDCTPEEVLDRYSNYGYTALGQIIEEVSGQSVMNYVRSRILTPTIWIPSTEVIHGRTCRDDQNPREPYYRHPGCVTTVFDNFTCSTPYGLCKLPLVERPYGRSHIESQIGHGGMVVSAAPLLEFADRYRIGRGANIGRPLADVPFGGEYETHGGLHHGVSTGLWQRSDGINVFVFLNRGRFASGKQEFAQSFYYDELRPYLDENPPNVNTTSDGFWTQTNGIFFGGVGGYDRPFMSFLWALHVCTDGSRIRLRPGSTGWTGTINKRLRLDAPLGPATIGGQ